MEVVIIGDAPSLETACSRLIAAANAGGGADNTTVVLVEVARLSSDA
jgi:serine/threonine protein phosphatase PrpC